MKNPNTPSTCASRPPLDVMSPQLQGVATATTRSGQRRRLRLGSSTVVLMAMAALLTVSTGCGGDEKSDAHAAHTRHSATPGAAASASDGYVVPQSGKIAIEAGDNMRFNRTRFSVSPGQQIELTLRHTGRMPVNAMGHDIVLLKAYTDVQAFAQAAARSSATDHIPRSMSNQVLAHTHMLGGGESDTITFTAPTAPGEYDFICTFPAHYAAGMRGKMIVREE